jgi:hypothetical protein
MKRGVLILFFAVSTTVLIWFAPGAKDAGIRSFNNLFLKQSTARESKSDIANVTTNPDIANPIKQPFGKQSSEATQSWREFLRSPQLGLEIARAANSNESTYSGAALYALITYCSEVANNAPNFSTDDAFQMMSTFKPNLSKGFSFADKATRVREIELARERCFGEQNGLTTATLKTIRSRLFEKAGVVNALVAKIESDTPFNLSSLTLEEKELLSAGRLDVLSRVVIAFGDRLATENQDEKSRQIRQLYLKNMALCELGDDCEKGSVAFSYVCANFGACAGTSVQDSIKIMMGQDNLVAYGDLVGRSREVAMQLTR